jgi:hypothetical protein
LSRSGVGILGCAGDCSILRNVHPASSAIGTLIFLEEKAAVGVKLTAHVYTVPSLRISGAVPLLPLYTVMARTRTVVSFTVQSVVCRCWAIRRMDGTYPQQLQNR